MSVQLQIDAQKGIQRQLQGEVCHPAGKDDE